ncbi:ABC transporter ATP-binding protein [Anaerovorax odorimutans]|uniref:ABC transporter ATP-binding protein n=1 Tax=Anaerovorax odorimutans TaxID=109327 RepID=UPI0003F75917|nr:ABC transporter ATP-binding protein [Anaerovorax odorimutans]
MKLLEINKLNSGYGDVQVLKDISLTIEQGEIVSIVGANGAGKTTLMKTISGQIHAYSGEILFMGEQVEHLPAHKIAAKGIIQVPEGRKLFPFMTVYENLLIGSTMKHVRKSRQKNLEYIFDLLPRLKERGNQVASTLSGGEQQMLAIGRALMENPKILMLDEPSLGLSPLLVGTVFEIIETISKAGTTVMLVEQNVKRALKLSKRTYVLENGIIAMEGDSSQLIDDPHIKKAYLGL